MRFPSPSKPQALGLALWSFGMVIVSLCSLTAVVDVSAQLLWQSYNTLRKRLRDSYREAGEQRTELDHRVLGNVAIGWLVGGQPMAIAMDATSL